MRHDIEKKEQKHDRKYMKGRLDRVRVKLKVSWTKKSWMEIIWTEAI